MDGVLLCDTPPEEGEGWWGLAAAHGLATVFLVSPQTPPERLQAAAQATTGFVYAVSRAGVTGARAELPPHLVDLVRRVQEATDKPVAVGFGISTPEHVRAVCELADGAIVGSAMVKVIAEAEPGAEAGAAEEFARRLAPATRKQR